MSYDLLFWKQSKRLELAPDEIADDLCDGVLVDGVDTLPIVDILKALMSEFAGFDYDAGESAIRTDHGTIDVFAGERYLNFMCYGDVDEAQNRLTRVLARFGCPLYDPQLDRRFDSEGGTELGVQPSFIPPHADVLATAVVAAATVWESSTARPQSRVPRGVPISERLGPAKSPLTGDVADLHEPCGPLAVTDRAICGGVSKSLRCWTLGWEEAWQVAMPAQVNSISVDEEDLYVTTRDSNTSRGGSLQRVQRATGKVVWSRLIRSTMHEMAPGIAGDSVFLCNKKELLAFEKDSGKPLWHQAFSFARTAPIVWPEQRRVIVANSSTLACFDAKTGEEVWSRDWRYCQPQRIDNKLWVHRHGEWLYRVDTATGENMERIEIDVYSEILFDGEAMLCETYHHDDEAYVIGSIDPSVGRVRWEVEVPREPGNGRLSPNPRFIHNRCMVVETPFGPAYGVRVTDGGMQWKIEIATVKSYDPSVYGVGPVVCTPAGCWLLAACKRYAIDI